MTMSALYMWPWVAALTVAAAAPSCSVRLYPHLARPQDHPTFATRAARPLLPEDLASVPVWGGPRGMPPGVRQDPTNASAVSEFLGLFEQRVGAGMYFPGYTDLCAPWLETVLGVPPGIRKR